MFTIIAWHEGQVGYPTSLPFGGAWPMFRTREEGETWLARYRDDLITDFAEWPGIAFVVVEVPR